MKRLSLGFLLFWSIAISSEGMVISEIMYHPTAENEASYEWIELYNDYAVPLDIGGWSFSRGIAYEFPRGIIMQGKAYLVVCADKAAMEAMYGIPSGKLMGPFEGRLDNSGEDIALVDRMSAVMAHVDYKDRDPWPAGADGAGHSLALINTDLENDESESWAVSPQRFGSPGEANGFEVLTTVTDTALVEVGEYWKYFKGTVPPSDPVDAWIDPEFDDSDPTKWLSGQTGIGYGDGDDAMILDDMQDGYFSVYLRKRFGVTDLASIETVVLKVAYDDGFIAWVNRHYIGRKNMGQEEEVFTFDQPSSGSVGELPESVEFNVLKSYLHEGPDNVLAIQVHNSSKGSTDLSMIPSLVSRRVKTTGGVTPMPVVINEFLANSTGETFVELFNNSNSRVDIGLTYLSDDRANLTKFRIPQDTFLEAWDHIAFTGTEMGFALPQTDAAIYFTTADGSRVVDAYAYAAERPEMSRGRYPDGGKTWYTMTTPTPGDPNQVSLNTSIVINELMYHPYDNNDDLEYIELYNRGNEDVDLSGWRFSKGVDFVFQPGMSLASGDYLVVAKNQEVISQRYGISNVVGNFTGSLDNEGENVQLVDTLDNMIDEVRYSGGEPWPIWSAGWGASLELIDPRQDNDAACSWEASDESGRGGWTHIQYTGQFNGGESEFHFFLMHRGECLIDDISMTRAGQEHIGNGSFESGTSGWKIEGDHIRSTISTQEAHTGSRCLRIIATGRGDTGANRIECDTTTALAAGQSYTISFWVKWQKGINLIYTRTHNQGAAKANRFPMPEPRGTPGKRNTAFRANAGPAISNVIHKPIVPKSNELVKVTARITDADGVSSVSLFYKGDNDTTYNSVPMYDDGLHNDMRANDGLCVGEIPPRGATTLMRFYIVAQDSVAASQRFPTVDGTYCLYQIEDTPPATKLPIYRILLTREVDQVLRSRARLSNQLEDYTFILNNSQVFYNCGIRPRGSGWTRSNHPASQYRIEFPADKLLLGIWKEINLDWHGDGTKQHDRTVHHLLRELGGVQTSYHKYVHVRFNGAFTALGEDVQKVDGDFVRLYWPDDAQGNLFEVDDYFEWTDSWSHSHWDAYLRWEGPDKEEYRWNWELRTNEKEDDYTDFLNLVYFMDPTKTNNTDFDARAETMVEVDEWLRVLCVRFLVDDWDTFGYSRGKNASIYKPYHRGDGTVEDPARYGKWFLIPWDSDLTFGNANAPIISSNFPCVKRMIERPQYLRRYYSYYLALTDSKSGAFARTNIDPVLDRNYYALTGESGVPSSPQGMKDFITNRISVVRSLIPSNPKFAVTTNSGLDFEVQEPSVTLEGTSPYSARTMTVSINDGPAQPFEPKWLDTRRWQATFALGPAENHMRLAAYDWNNTAAGAYTITVTWPLSPTEDSDGDGLFDRDEVQVYLTDYLNPDTDGDTLTDGNEVLLYLTNPKDKDTDADGLTDPDELNVYSTNPRKPDSDDDTLPDKWEVENDLDPNVADGDQGSAGDPDHDGLTNSDEYQNGTNPQSADTDVDGMSDSWEIRWGLNPKVATGADGPDDDPDADGLTNLQESQNATNPKSGDSDGDELSDLWEVQNNLDPNSAEGANGANGDPDSDGLTNSQEHDSGTNPRTNDTDGDLMDDRWELETSLDPTSGEGENGSDGDPDGDGLPNIQEYQNRTLPKKADSDDDGMDDRWELDSGLDPMLGTGDDGPDGDPDGDQITNLQEYQYGLDPLTPNTDTDADGLGDLWEIGYGLSPTSSEGGDGADGDPDGDTLTNAGELQSGTSPVNADTDSDEMPDGWEARNGLDPTSNSGDDGATGDPDADTLTNADEYHHGTNPKNGDTDADTMSDSWEVQNGLNPTSAEGDDGANGDPDGDGLTNLQEQTHSTNPHSGDTDQDNLRDLWEVENSLDPTSGLGDDGSDGDPDADGSQNLEEMIAGTDPHSAESLFTVVSITNNASYVTVSWTTVGSKRYRLLAADKLEGPWTPIAEGIFGTGMPENFADHEAVADGAKFYKVEVY